ncbi:MAG: hypothetical protein K9K67_09935 [Bacteriovoracaceae bacterium]|nr:hypothetical protein [Bacteriovoracaceae bacterium]
MENNYNIERTYEEYKRGNFKFLGPIAFIVYIALSFVDMGLTETSLWLLLSVRFFFILPTIFLSLNVEKIKVLSVDQLIFTSFFFAGIGISIISYLLGGLSSDYYFGILIISFVQFAFAPMSFKMTLILDITLFLIFFCINTLPFNYPTEEIIKQASNYITFIVLKLLTVHRSKSLIMSAIVKVDLEKELENQKHVQKVLGELCHLFNNPLFISMSLIKKLKSEKGFSDENIGKLERVLDSNERMRLVLRKMLDITEKKSKVNIEDLTQ